MFRNVPLQEEPGNLVCKLINFDVLRPRNCHFQLRYVHSCRHQDKDHGVILQHLCPCQTNYHLGVHGPLVHLIGHHNRHRVSWLQLSVVDQRIHPYCFRHVHQTSCLSGILVLGHVESNHFMTHYPMSPRTSSASEMVTFRLCCEHITSPGLVARSAQCSSNHLIASQGATVDLPVPVGPWIIIVLSPTVSDRSCFALSARLAIPLRVALNRSTNLWAAKSEYPEPLPPS